jgi:hypothetical protein
MVMQSRHGWTMRFALLILSLASARPVVACSVAVGAPLYRGPRQTFFLGTALSDTVFAGPGANRWRSGGVVGQSSPHPIYGQLVRVDVPGGALPGTTTRAILVPWDYCGGMTPWVGSARWLEPGASGLYDAAVRDTADWVDGIPTFDVRAIPGSLPYRGGYDGAPVRMLSAEQLFDLLQAATSGGDGRASLRAVDSWIADRPGIKAYDPAFNVRSLVEFEVAQEALRPRMAVRGTYEVTASITGAPDRSFFIRTHDAIANLEWNPRLTPMPIDSLDAFTAYAVTVSVASDSAFNDRLRFLGRMRGEDWLQVDIGLPFTPGSRNSGARMFDAHLSDRDLALLLGEDPAIEQVREAGPLRFTVYPSGTTFELRRTLVDGRIVELRGHRIAAVTVPR